MVLVTAGLLVVVGIALMVSANETVTGFSFAEPEGSGGAGYSSEASFAFDGAWLVTEQAAIGCGLVWLGSLLAAGAIGFRAAVRRATEA
jgi:hypothetical protein